MIYPPGTRKTSVSGEHYMADVHGTLRRIHTVAGNGVDPANWFTLTRWGKARRKAEKRKRIAFRNEFERQAANGDPNP